jgi:hypothetical protein
VRKVIQIAQQNAAMQRSVMLPHSTLIPNGRSPTFDLKMRRATTGISRGMQHRKPSVRCIMILDFKLILKRMPARQSNRPKKDARKRATRSKTENIPTIIEICTTDKAFAAADMGIEPSILLITFWAGSGRICEIFRGKSLHRDACSNPTQKRFRPTEQFLGIRSMGSDVARAPRELSTLLTAVCTADTALCTQWQSQIHFAP